MRNSVIKILSKRLTEKQEEVAEQWVIENNEDFLSEFIAFKIKYPVVFPSFLFSESVFDMYTSKPGQ